MRKEGKRGKERERERGRRGREEGPVGCFLFLFLLALFSTDWADVLLPSSFHPFSLVYCDTHTITVEPLLALITADHESVHRREDERVRGGG